MTKGPDDIVMSPLSMKFVANGITVDIRIYRTPESNGWVLELVDENEMSTIWEEPFPTDQAALDEFRTGVDEIGLAKLLEVDEGPVTLH